MKQEAADEFLGLKGEGLFSISIFAISIAQEDFSVFDFKDAVIGQSHAVGVATEVIQDSLWGAERLFGIDHPILFA